MVGARVHPLRDSPCPKASGQLGDIGLVPADRRSGPMCAPTQASRLCDWGRFSARPTVIVEVEELLGTGRSLSRRQASLCVRTSSLTMTARDDRVGRLAALCVGVGPRALAARASVPGRSPELATRPRDQVASARLRAARLRQSAARHPHHVTSTPATDRRGTTRIATTVRVAVVVATDRRVAARSATTTARSAVAVAVVVATTVRNAIAVCRCRCHQPTPNHHSVRLTSPPVVVVLSPSPAAARSLTLLTLHLALDLNIY